MSQAPNETPSDKSSDDTMQTIMAALQSSYGSLDDPNFHAINAAFLGGVHQHLIDTLRAKCSEVIETTDQNDDVSRQLVLSQDGVDVALGLSAVGPFATLHYLDTNGRSCWVDRQDDAPTPLAALVASAVEGAGLRLLDRDTVSWTIRMRQPDGTSTATLYQALFTDTDRVP